MAAPVAELMAQGRWEDAYVWFREHQDRFSRREQKLIRAVLTRKLWRAPVLLAVQCYERLVVAPRLFGQRPPWARAGAAWALTLLLAGWSVWTLIPYAQDLPQVLAGEWNTGIVTLEMEEATALNNVLVEMGREPVSDYDPIPWYSNPRWSKLLMPIMPGQYPNHGYRTDDGRIVRRAYCYGIIHSK